MFVRWFCLYGGIKAKCFGTSKTSCKVLIVSTETTYEKGHERMDGKGEMQQQNESIYITHMNYTYRLKLLPKYFNTLSFKL